MKKAISAGVIPYRTTRNKIEYLILKGRTYDWEFPKGGIEQGEELQQTAIREINEETGISDIKLLNNFKESYSYVFSVNGQRIDKTVHLFLGKVFNTNVELSKEHLDYQWRTYDLAYNTLSHDSTKQILTEANTFLLNNIEPDLENQNQHI